MITEPLPKGTKVKIRGIRDEDKDLNGRTGVIRSKVMFPTMFTPASLIFGDIGVTLDKADGADFTEQVNVLWQELIEI